MATLHVYPTGDVTGHDTATSEPDCVCGPHVEPALGSGGTVTGWLIVHHSLDGRERHEPHLP